MDKSSRQLFVFIFTHNLSGLEEEPKEQTQDFDRKTMFDKKPKMKVEVVRVELLQGECRRGIQWSELLADSGSEKIGWLAGRQTDRMAGPTVQTETRCWACAGGCRTLSEQSV